MSLFKSTLLRPRLRQGKENIVIFGIITFLIVSFLGLYSMPVDESGNMVSCPFMQGSSSFCQMSVPEHVSQWKQLFAVIQGNNLLLLLSTLLISITVALFNINAKAHNKLKFQRFSNYFYWYKPEIKLFDHLIIAFSQGKIHPQIYA